MSSDAAIVLAAGKGTRMYSRLPKVLHHLAGKPMLLRVLETLAAVDFACPTVVVGYGADEIERTVGARCAYVNQGEQLGTGHAARVAMEALPDAGRVLLVHGDEPMIEAHVYREILDLQAASGSPVVLLTTHAADLRGFGRVIRDSSGHPVALVQESDLTLEQRSVTEVNLGAYVFDAAFLREHLPALQPHPPKGEYYLTDLIAVAAGGGQTVEAVTVPGGADVMGINTLEHLETANGVIYRRTARRLMASGVTIVDSATTFIDDEAQIEPETTIHPFTIIRGATHIGRECEIGPGSHILSSRIGDGCRILSSTVRDSAIGDRVKVGPYAHLRDGARIGDDVRIGTGSEVKGSTLGAGSTMNHFGYVGDAQVGAKVNIAAGVITCNYDGRAKHRTVIGDGAFIGSDTMLRAPVTIGAGAYTGAGSVVTRDVPPGVTVAGVPARALTTRTER